jgi:two-component system chemotaxis sensor kinase CheA
MVNDKFQIVIVDDSEDILEMYKEFLSELEHEVICFSDPIEAKDHIKNGAQNIILLILDYSLPEMTGMELRSQTMESAGDIPAVVVTGFYDEKMAVEGMKQKVQAFISKPFKQEEILNAITEFAAPRLSYLNEELEMKESFVEESSPMVEEIEDLILVLEDDPENETALNTYFRLLHTIKGTASCVGLNVIANYVHYYEELVSDLKAKKTKVNKAVIDVLLEGLDRVKEMYRSISEREELSFDPSVELKIFKKDFNKVGAVDNGEDDSEVTSIEQESPRASTYKKSSKKSDDEKIQVSVEILDQFMELSGELTVLRNTIIKNSMKIDTKYPGDRDVDTLKDSLDEMYKVSSTLQQSISEMRKVGADTILRPLKRIVRDATKHLKKDVIFETSGEEIRLDTSLSKVLSNVLVHMVRNGVDHGIELPDSRKENGKDPQGQLSLDLRQDGEMIIIDLKDDGKGLDQNVLKKKALEKGLYTQEELNKMSTQRVFHFIFESGFSTAEAVTDLSGRGVGMDMVNSSIRNIGGKIKIDSTLGEGTQFQICAPIPRSVLIIKSLLISSGGVKFCLPLDCISDVVNLEVSHSVKIHNVSGARMIRHHDKLVPYVSLRETLLIDDKDSEERSIVFLVHEGHHYGVAVDEIFDIEEVVAKKLAPKVDEDQLFVGATVLGEGEVGYILSVEGVALRAGIQKKVDVEDFGESLADFGLRHKDFMQFELKQKGLYAVEIDYVHRLEVFSKERVEYRGDAICPLPRTSYALTLYRRAPGSPGIRLVSSCSSIWSKTLWARCLRDKRYWSDSG